MALRDIDICANALVRLGEAPIQSFEDGGDPSTVCATVYPRYRAFLLSCYPWRFTIFKIELARNAVAPLNEWRYAYDFPGDLINGPLAIFRDNDEDAATFTRYEQYGRQVFTDEDRIFADYQRDVLEENWPAYFVEFAVEAFAAEIAMAITDNASLEQVKKVSAWGGNMNGGKFLKAKTEDARRQPTPSLFQNGDPIMAARIGSSHYMNFRYPDAEGG